MSSACVFVQDRHGICMRHRGPVGAIRGQGIVDIGGGEDHGLKA